MAGRLACVSPAPLLRRAASSLAHLALELSAARPHDFTLQYPIRREFFQENYSIVRAPAGAPGDALLAGLGRGASLSGRAEQGHAPGSPVLLYVHVPFCRAKCHYCNFAVDTRADTALHEAYLSCLIDQIAAVERRLAPGVRVRGIDIGGGTPTVLSTAQLARLVRALDPWLARCDVPHPISIETTPHIAASEPAKMAALAAAGVDRISMGMQTTDAATLVSLNRAAQVGDVNEAAMANLRAAGFRRVSLDLIFALPGQSLAQWRADVARAISLEPDSITTYDCLYRGKGRAFSRRVARLPSWTDTYGPAYDAAHEQLAEAGFRGAYGSVNFARHAGETGTSPYFEGRLLAGLPYVGLGNYATSMIDSLWGFAPYTVDAWLAARATSVLPVAALYRLPPDELAAKLALLQLSFGGLHRRLFAAATGDTLEAVFGERLSEVAVRDKAWLRLSPDGERYALREGCFQHLPQLRALMHTRASLHWFDARLREAREGPPSEPARLPRRSAKVALAP